MVEDRLLSAGQRLACVIRLLKKEKERINWYILGLCVFMMVGGIYGIGRGYTENEQIKVYIGLLMMITPIFIWNDMTKW